VTLPIVTLFTWYRDGIKHITLYLHSVKHFALWFNRPNKLINKDKFELKIISMHFRYQIKSRGRFLVLLAKWIFIRKMSVCTLYTGQFQYYE